MHAFEYLRHVARGWDPNADVIAEDAALALAELADDPAVLTLACRRLLEAHRSCTPLWWVIARVIAASDPRRAASEARRALREDPTVFELATAYLTDADIACCSTETIVSSIECRPDIRARLVLPRSRRGRLEPVEASDQIEQFDVAEIDRAVSGASMAVVEAEAASEDGFLLCAPARQTLHAAERGEIPVLVVVREGRLLPTELFASLLRSTRSSQSEGASSRERVVSPRQAWRVAGPGGVQLPALALSAVRCSAPAELIHLKW